MSQPDYWINKSSPALKHAIEAYLFNEPMRDNDITVMRAYLRQWILRGNWTGPLIDPLRTKVNEITTRTDIHDWLCLADKADVDPL